MQMANKRSENVVQNAMLRLKIVIFVVIFVRECIKYKTH